MNFAELLDSFAGKRILTIGDLMLDEYHFGQATRISPEAPVMVIQHSRSDHLPGGAANVALNLKALGAEPVLVGISGQDAAGEQLIQSLEESGLSGSRVIRDPSRPTTKKTRIVANHAHQVLRLDFEGREPLDAEIESRLLAAVLELVPQSDAVLISDYLKGACTPRIVECTVREAKRASIPVAANPKPRSLALYRGADLASLNYAEAVEAQLPPEFLGEGSGAAAYLQREGFGAILVTMGERGMRAVGSETYHIPAPKVEVYDTAGAGDTVVATVALGLASVGFRREVFELAAQTAACVVRHVGVASPSPSDLEAIRRHEIPA